MLNDSRSSSASWEGGKRFPQSPSSDIGIRNGEYYMKYPIISQKNKAVS